MPNSEHLLVSMSRRSPTSVAAAVIHMITQLSTENKFLKGFEKYHESLFLSAEICISCAMTKNVFMQIYPSWPKSRKTQSEILTRDLYPHARKILPESCAKEEDLRKLCCLSIVYGVYFSSNISIWSNLRLYWGKLMRTFTSGACIREYGDAHTYSSSSLSHYVIFFLFYFILRQCTVHCLSQARIKEEGCGRPVTTNVKYCHILWIWTKN